MPPWEAKFWIPDQAQNDSPPKSWKTDYYDRGHRALAGRRIGEDFLVLGPR